MRKMKAKYAQPLLQSLHGPVRSVQHTTVESNVPAARCAVALKLLRKYSERYLSTDRVLARYYFASMRRTLEDAECDYIFEHIKAYK